MPHKKNPIGAENISGLARLVRSNGLAALENMALWHERDISHSSVERVIAPDSTILIDYMIHRLSRIVKTLAVYPERMKENLNRRRGLIFSQQVLLRLSNLGLSREKSYEWVQRNALKVWAEGKDFKSLLAADADIRKYLDLRDLEEIFDIGYHLKHVDQLFGRVWCFFVIFAEKMEPIEQENAASKTNAPYERSLTVIVMGRLGKVRTFQISRSLLIGASLFLAAFVVLKRRSSS